MYGCVPVSLSRVSEGVKEGRMAKLQWFWHRTSQWNLGLVDPFEMYVLLWWCHSPPSLNKSGNTSSTLNMMQVGSHTSSDC